eukprot:329699-Prymnesium_polylepis.1
MFSSKVYELKPYVLRQEPAAARWVRGFGGAAEKSCTVCSVLYLGYALTTRYNLAAVVYVRDWRYTYSTAAQNL